MDDVANDNKIVKNSNLTEQSVKTISKKIKTSISTEPISDRDSSKDFYLKARVIGENNARVANANVTVSFYEIDAYYDASYGNQSVRQALEAIKDENLIILYGNVDSTTVRDKKESGRVIGDYANIVIASGYVEITDTLDMNSAIELLSAIENDDVIKMAVCTMDESAELAMKYLFFRDNDCSFKSLRGHDLYELYYKIPQSDRNIIQDKLETGKRLENKTVDESIKELRNHFVDFRYAFERFDGLGINVFFKTFVCTICDYALGFDNGE